MVFGFLGEFFDAITDAVVGTTTFTIEYFENIGKAVAGALGNIIALPLQALVDFMLAFTFLLNALQTFFVILIEPIKLAVKVPSTFLEAFLTAGANPTPVFDANVITFINTIPSISILLLAVGAAVIFLAFLSVFKILHNL